MVPHVLLIPPRARLAAAAAHDPWIVNSDRRERLIAAQPLKPISPRSRFAVLVARVAAGRSRVTRYALLWRQAAWWAVIEVTRDVNSLGCGLADDSARAA